MNLARSDGTYDDRTNHSMQSIPWNKASNVQYQTERKINAIFAVELNSIANSLARLLLLYEMNKHQSPSNPGLLLTKKEKKKKKENLANWQKLCLSDHSEVAGPQN